MDSANGSEEVVYMVVLLSAVCKVVSNFCRASDIRTVIEIKKLVFRRC